MQFTPRRNITQSFSRRRTATFLPFFPFFSVLFFFFFFSSPHACESPFKIETFLILRILKMRRSYHSSRRFYNFLYHLSPPPPAEFHPRIFSSLYYILLHSNVTLLSKKSERGFNFFAIEDFVTNLFRSFGSLIRWQASGVASNCGPSALSNRNSN